MPVVNVDGLAGSKTDLLPVNQRATLVNPFTPTSCNTSSLLQAVITRFVVPSWLRDDKFVRVDHYPRNRPVE